LMCWSFLPHVRFLILLMVFELLPKTCNFTICSIFSNSSQIKVNFKLQNRAAYQDLPTLQFCSKSHYSFWSYFPFFIKFSKF
jgi:hypothetical protein